MNKQPKSAEQTLNDALKKYSANIIDQQFNWDASAKTWCISGHDQNNNYFETDNFEAEDLADAQWDAADYLETYNEQF
jgi:hypothetical protein